MSRSKRIGLAAAAAVVALGFGGVSAFAQSNVPGAPGPGAHGPQGHRPQETGSPYSAFAAVLTAKVSPLQAITAAEQKSGGHAEGIGMRVRPEATFYDVRVSTKDGASDVFVDPDSGAILNTAPAPSFRRGGPDRGAQLASEPTTLATAIGTAEQQTGGKVVGAAFGGPGGSGLFGLIVVKDHAIEHAVIDGKTGVLFVTANDGFGQRRGRDMHRARFEHGARPDHGGPDHGGPDHGGLGNQGAPGAKGGPAPQAPGVTHAPPPKPTAPSGT